MLYVTHVYCNASHYTHLNYSITNTYSTRMRIKVCFVYFIMSLNLYNDTFDVAVNHVFFFLFWKQFFFLFLWLTEFLFYLFH